MRKPAVFPQVKGVCDAVTESAVQPHIDVISTSVSNLDCIRGIRLGNDADAIAGSDGVAFAHSEIADFAGAG